ncbi:hypothetical protein SAMN05216229_10295 [Geopseudomonas sagittaria]|uniref:Uncharacterized protein n=1 Tax=Geopseudomonas sagittaria TaxID=1135990 RepID=A0A1I5PXU4_9GAMM|nr:hypothetical protein [Pseudomonas sagittaria]SFP38938.1 hypothetical protein SAMN05216229_10295 [Pseudomonas sagittaria]
MDVISAIQASIESAKKLRELSKKLQDAEFSMALADLNNSLADAKLEAAGLKEQLAAQKELNLQLSEKLAQRETGKPVCEDGSYVFEGESGNFCTGCWDAKGMKIRLTEEKGAFRAFGKWSCPSCQQCFGQ